MKRLAAGVVVFVLCAASVASAQVVNVGKDGKITVKGKAGNEVVVGKDGQIKVKEPKGKTADEGDNGDLLVGTSSTTDGTMAETITCKHQNDASVTGQTVKANPAVLMTATCDVDIEKSTLESDEIGAQVSGTGDLTIVASTITAKKVGIVVTGTGDVVLEKVTLTGPVAIRITGTGTVTAKDSTITGHIEVLGKGEFKDGGGNTIVKGK